LTALEGCNRSMSKITAYRITREPTFVSKFSKSLQFLYIFFALVDLRFFVTLF